MPEVHFRVRWPDDSVMHAYSPSSTIKDALRLGHPYPVAEFVAQSRAALEHASDRVAQRYGFGCGHAAAQIREIERVAQGFNGASQTVIVEAFED
ncbi:putative repeat protein (TIGR04042 family) [Panacagrimonas perspica]|uniref:Putative repeat protein (TIGR04042 family) n=1 Tax=Panacagrimonas perspica TaxID=381431 RepID=A0A4S3KB97_9GAMM|nr:MSMEG_0570 family nitrogen starvation response protein [Panacagrimonas perspica]TDU32759.1 putative repeat protein (TIGR04042 family) [Panacagrimonas perspica]THD05636.1 hypothetical protein B1810_02680 [Panacagrimonas perspica]